MTTFSPPPMRGALLLDSDQSDGIALAALALRTGQKTMPEILADEFGDNIIIFKPRSET